MIAKTRPIPLLGLALVAVAGPVAAGGTAPVAEDSVRSDVVQIRVVNRNWLDMRIYAVVEGRRVRLGTVTGLTSETIKIRPSLVGPGTDLRLEAVPLGRRRASHAASIVIFPGQDLEYRIQNSIGLSYIRRI